jgi:tetratricopeptide (TPR) repeat protein
MRGLDLEDFKIKRISDLTPDQALQYDDLLQKLKPEFDKGEQSVILEGTSSLEPLFHIYNLCKKSKTSKKHKRAVEKLILGIFAAPVHRNAPGVAGGVQATATKLTGPEQRIQFFNLHGRTAPDLIHVSIGQRRLEIELSDDAVTAAIAHKLAESGRPKPKPDKDAVISNWNYKVATIANILQENGITADMKDGTFSTELQELFLLAIWGIMYGNLNIRYGTNTSSLLWESLFTNNYDCDNSAFLVFDVAARIGIPLELLLVPGHALVRTHDFFFETTNGLYSGISGLKKEYPRIDAIVSVSDLAAAEALAYNVRASAKIDLNDYRGAIADSEKAIKMCPHLLDSYVTRDIAETGIRNEIESKPIADYDEAIKRTPNDADLYYARGAAKAGQGYSAEAIADYNKAISLRPDYAEAYARRALAKNLLKDYTGALSDLDEAIKRNPRYATAYLYRSWVKKALGDQDGAKADSNTYDRLKFPHGP